MRLERCLLNLWVKGESKRALKASFQEVEQLLTGHGASNPTGSKVKALSCQKHLFIIQHTHSPKLHETISKLKTKTNLNSPVITVNYGSLN